MATTNIEINGVINTRNDVLSNINKIADAAGAFVTWDVELGKWSIILNEPANATKTFTASNIVGGITVGGAGLTETYNSATMRFPHKDLKDDIDFVTVEIPSNQRYQNEFDNELTVTTDLVNDPVQAQYLASLDLLQSRLDVIVQFNTDFTGIGLTAGEVIKLTDPQYGFNEKLFRVISVKEVDTQDGTLLLDITAQEYGNIWGTPLARTDANKQNGIIPKNINQCIDLKDKIDLANLVSSILIPAALNAGETALRNVFENDGQGNITHSVGTVNECFVPLITRLDYSITGPSMVCENEIARIIVQGPQNVFYQTGSSVDYVISGVSPDDIGIPLTGTIPISTSGEGILDIPVTTAGGTENDENMLVVIETACGIYSHTVVIHDNYLTNPVYTVTPDKSSVTECQSLTFTICASNTDDGVAIPYTITGISAADVTQASLLSGTVAVNWCDTCAFITIDFVRDNDVGDENVIFTLGNNLATATVPLYDDYTYTVVWNAPQITEGETSTATITIDGGIPDGTQLPYTLGGDTDCIITPALQGVLTVNGGQATLNLQTFDDSDYSGLARLVTLNVGPVEFKHCSGYGTIEILDNDTPPNQLGCVYTEVPVVWCGQYEAGSLELSDLLIRKRMAFMTSPQVGTAVVLPKEITVTQGNPSVINVIETITVYTGSGMGGTDINVINSFNNIAAGQPITGTTVSVRGYDAN